MDSVKNWWTLTLKTWKLNHLTNSAITSSVASEYMIFNEILRRSHILSCTMFVFYVYRLLTIFSLNLLPFGVAVSGNDIYSNQTNDLLPNKVGPLISENGTSHNLTSSKALVNHTDFQQSESEQQKALRSFFDATNMKSAKNGSNWFDGQYIIQDNSYDFCSFEGIECKHPNGDNLKSPDKQSSTTTSKSVITGIHLKDKNLSGTLPSNFFTAVVHLETLDFASNDISGTIPPAISQLSELRDVDFSNNRLVGEFPTFNDTQSHIKRITLASNDLQGTLPKSVCTLKNLEFLDLSKNEMMGGQLPLCLGHLEKLDFLKFDGVGFDGTIPEALCSTNRSMNGFARNVFGCAAIACPAGKYEPAFGRQTNESLPCLPCLAAKKLGSRKCPKGQSKSPYPTWPPSLHPSIQPSSHVTDESKSSPPPSISISGYPTMVNILTIGPIQSMPAPSTASPLPLTFQNKTLLVKLWIQGIRTLFSDQNEVSSFEDTVATFLRKETASWDHPVFIDSVKILDQNIVENMISPQKHRIVLLSSSSTRRLGALNQGRTLYDGTLELRIGMTEDQQIEDMVRSWDHNFDSFLLFLKNSTEVRKHFDNLRQPDGQEEDKQGQARASVVARKHSVSELLYVAVVISLVAMVSSIGIFIHRRKKQTANSYKRQWNTDLSVSSSSALPVEAAPSRDESEVETKANFSAVWNHCGTSGNGGISEESDGGWNTGSGSGSTADAEIYGTKVGRLGQSNSSLYMLDPYSQEDVWSVSPDQQLCLSGSLGNNSDLGGPKEVAQLSVDKELLAALKQMQLHPSDEMDVEV